VTVKGRRLASGIYEVRRSLSDREEKAWKKHEEALAFYYERKFGQAEAAFRDVISLLPQDHCTQLFLSRCTAFTRSPPPSGWTGVVELTEK
jgi:adenylate cyclase